MRCNICLSFALLSLSTFASAGESSTMVEHRDGKTVTTGKLLAKNKEQAVLLDRKGALHYLELKETPLKPLTGSFQSLPVTDLRNQLSREFGKDYEVGTSRHYLVVAASGRATGYAKVFEEQFTTLQRYLKTRGFALNEVPYPLVAIVFTDRQQFVSYAESSGSKAMTGMLGFYSPKTNRVALFETRGKQVTDAGTHQLGGDSAAELLIAGNSPRLRDLFQPSGRSAVNATQGDLQATMVHEATHQLAYNFGLHSRVSETPRWVAEGLATTFEPEGVRDSSAGRDIKQRINRERFIEFQNYAKSRRPAKSLKTFIEGDSLYESAISDFYAQSWAVTFFLIETRPRNFADYLKRIAARDAFSDYPATDRLADFRETIHKDVDWLDGQFVKYIDGLK